jgi:hypothetical protein
VADGDLVDGFVDKSSHFSDKDCLQDIMWGGPSLAAVGYSFSVLTRRENVAHSQTTEQLGSP